MALSKSTAGKIVAAVAADPECQRVINWPLISPKIDPALPPVIQSIANAGRTILEFTGNAGATRNALLLLAGKGPGDASFDEKICLGISVVTQKAILKAMSAGRIPEIRSCSPAHREVGVFHVHHQATGVRTADDTWYIFDWHATLKLSNPAISKESFWLLGAAGISYVFFKGFD